MKAYVNVPMFLICAADGILMAAVSFCLILEEKWEGWIFVPFAVLFVVLAAGYGSIVRTRNGCLEHIFLGICIRKMDISGIVEIGIADTDTLSKRKLFRKLHTYIYCSECSMDEQERFMMSVKWPPKDKIYIRYTDHNLRALRKFWDGPIENSDS